VSRLNGRERYGRGHAAPAFARLARLRLSVNDALGVVVPRDETAKSGMPAVLDVRVACDRLPVDPLAVANYPDVAAQGAATPQDKSDRRGTLHQREPEAVTPRTADSGGVVPA
jgi:hypothetical protein